MERRKCILYEDRGECIECGDCSICDLDPSKICDNCGKCIGFDGSSDYLAIKVDGIITADMDQSEYIYDDDSFDDASEEGEDLVWP